MKHYILSAAAGYILGAVPFAWLVAKIFAGVDVRTVGSRNPGATNVYRSVGKTAGAAALALDALKGAAAVLLTSKFIAPGAADPSLAPAIAALFCVGGHSYTVFLNFRGGKGVAAALGAFAALAPAATGLGFVVFCAVYFIGGYVSAGSVAAAIITPPAAFIMGYPPATVTACSVAALVVIIRHRSNISRLARKEERKTPL